MNVSRRLNAYAKKHGLDTNKTRITFALERLVARLENDPALSRALIFKGGFVLLKSINTDRYTVDIDATAQTIDPDEAKSRVLAAAATNLDDGIAFGDIKISDLDIVTEEYGGIRMMLRFQLDVSSITEPKLSRLPLIHLDVAFGEYLPGKREKIPLDPILESDEFRLSWSVYPIEFIFAEKLQTLVARGHTSSRAKDIYDMAMLSEKIGSDPSELKDAIVKVFEKRGTSLPQNFQTFFQDLDVELLKLSWGAVKLKNPKSFEEAFTTLQSFLERVL